MEHEKWNDTSIQCNTAAVHVQMYVSIICTIVHTVTQNLERLKVKQQH